MKSVDRKELFNFMLECVRDLANTSVFDKPRAFSKWFLTLYYGLGPDAKIRISDGSGDGKVDAFFPKVDDRTVTHVLVNSKFTETFDQIAPPKFYDEIVRFRRAFDDTDSRDAYLKSVRATLRGQFALFFEQFDEGKAELIFVTNHRVNPKQIDAVANVGVKVLHLDDIIQCMVDNVEGAMPWTKDLILTDITQVLSPPRSETSVATSLVFAKLVDFIEYMKSDPHERLFARNVRLDLEGTEVNKEIADTFALHPEEFAFSNNGITMLCDKHTHASGTARLTVVNPRVVNGAQTLHSVRRAAKKPASARVMVKIIEISPPRAEYFQQDVTKRKDVVSKIALRTNSQNTIKKSDLVANDERQHEIAAFFRRKDLYYERRKNEWNIRKIELQSVGIDKGPTLKYLVQLGACYFWDSIGPAKARSAVTSLFEDQAYERIMSLSPQTFFRLFSIQGALIKAASRVASRTSRRNRELRKYVNFAMFSLFLKAVSRLRVDIVSAADLGFLSQDREDKWDALAKQLFKMINEHFRATAFRQRSNGALTIVNYSKNATFMSNLLKQRATLGVISAARSLVR